MGDAAGRNEGLSNAVYQKPGDVFGGSAANLPTGWSVGGESQSTPNFFAGPGGRQTASLSDAWGQSGQTPTGFDAFGPTLSGGTPDPGSFGGLRSLLGGNQPLDPDVLEFMGPSGRTHMSRGTYDAMRASPGGFPGGFVGSLPPPSLPPPPVAPPVAPSEPPAEPPAEPPLPAGGGGSLGMVGGNMQLDPDGNWFRPAQPSDPTSFLPGKPNPAPLPSWPPETPPPGFGPGPGLPPPKVPINKAPL